MATKFEPYAVADEKEKARIYVANHYKGGRVLSMSSSNFGFEHTLLRMHPNVDRIDCYENDIEVYQKGRYWFEQINEQYKNIHFIRDNVFNANAPKYKFMFLDFCGTVTPTHLTRLVTFLQGFDGTCFITVLKGRGLFTEEVLSLFNAESPKDFRERVFPSVIAQYTNLEESIPRYEYQNASVNKMSVHMQLYGFQTKGLIN